MGQWFAASTHSKHTGKSKDLEFKWVHKRIFTHSLIHLFIHHAFIFIDQLLGTRYCSTCCREYNGWDLHILEIILMNGKMENK